MTAIDIFWVGIGGGSGSLLRWWVGKLTGERYHGHFPLGTFIINVSGAFVIGFLSTLFVIDWHDRFGSFLHAAILTGILGGYTTFSSMQLDAAKLVNSKQRMLAFGYLLISVVAGLAAAALGVWLAA
ncbi:TPA: fluoride efflux transporter CrcB [Morganella morganii subsp. morganii]|uniref:Fluoride-specific ion channel FluC n=1 Tax=Morganella morganii TaxID=582 RepID=A0AAU8ZS18_MORMO|nr:fluoride efflux transporter CrcB [Morganella morganii]HDU8694306.1 fluoride efflux transporter CrcB [Morganella morganii subsp. morganii]AWC95581.1 fluoride efflux transporter CrcB [Morganella morganii]EKW8484798.1 fluoride efflux transporter CrcB [Morganella morganii]HAT3623954.1 fluoride efflux transporter CrcB [Morganella morganii]HCU0877559.1 fluoride efflux transporter CrcB [Morganella morganii]